MGVSAQRKKMQVERRREQAYQEANEKGWKATENGQEKHETSTTTTTTTLNTSTIMH